MFNWFVRSEQTPSIMFPLVAIVYMLLLAPSAINLDRWNPVCFKLSTKIHRQHRYSVSAFNRKFSEQIHWVLKNYLICPTEFDSCYSLFMPHQMTPRFRHRAREVHYYVHYYYIRIYLSLHMVANFHCFVIQLPSCLTCPDNQGFRRRK